MSRLLRMFFYSTYSQKLLANSVFPCRIAMWRGVSPWLLEGKMSAPLLTSFRNMLKLPAYAHMWTGRDFVEATFYSTAFFKSALESRIKLTMDSNPNLQATCNACIELPFPIEHSMFTSAPNFCKIVSISRSPRLIAMKAALAPLSFLRSFTSTVASHC